MKMGYLKRALCFNTTLESLYLWSCGVGDDGLISIAEGLCENTTLLRLELRKNAIDTAGYLALRYLHAIYSVLCLAPMRYSPSHPCITRLSIEIKLLHHSSLLHAYSDVHS
eukprot:m.93451 g.93451  ORF g.93451 m.93451 type:complete len:111 (+) comp12997_c2_seq7:55-387(+)